jgi:RNA 3'-terminal phosphate cyclase (ATP)
MSFGVAGEARRKTLDDGGGGLASRRAAARPEAAIGSQAISFTPGKVKAGAYTFSVGLAGSTTLVLQTVLPALLIADGPSSLTLEGGTHNPHAPPIDFLELAFLPLINRMGPTVGVAMERTKRSPPALRRWRWRRGAKGI